MSSEDNDATSDMTITGVTYDGVSMLPVTEYNIPDFSSQTECLSCNRGPGITIAHDHNLMGMVSGGIYPHGGLTIFDVRPKTEKMLSGD